MGQNAKYSMRADVFRFASKLRHSSMRLALRICEPGAAVARPRQATGGPRPTCLSLWMVHRRLRHARPEGGQGAPRHARIGIVCLTASGLGRGARKKYEHRPHAKCACCSPVRCQVKTNWGPMPGTGSPRLPSLLDAWCWRRAAAHAGFRQRGWSYQPKVAARSSALAMASAQP